jgi:integrase
MDKKEKITPVSRRGFEHRDILSNINKNLRIVAKKAELPVKLSTYSARYAWATLAADLDITYDVISYALGHKMGNPTTAIYIDFNLKKVDQANQKVIKTLTIGIGTKGQIH